VLVTSMPRVARPLELKMGERRENTSLFTTIWYSTHLSRRNAASDGRGYIGVRMRILSMRDALGALLESA
jgi:hypothetical protein